MVLDCRKKHNIAHSKRSCKFVKILFDLNWTKDYFRNFAHVPTKVQNTSQMMTQTASEVVVDLHHHEQDEKEGNGMEDEEERPQISSSSFLASPLQRLSDLARGQSKGIHAQTAKGNLRPSFRNKRGRCAFLTLCVQPQTQMYKKYLLSQSLQNLSLTNKNSFLFFEKKEKAFSETTSKNVGYWNTTQSW